MSKKLIGLAERLREELAGLTFAEPVTHVYNPLEYAWKSHREYLQRFGKGKKRVVLLGMNPGPYGMAQTGVPFGEIPAVRDWMKIDVAVDKPVGEHPKRPVTGFACTRSEVSGRRLWGLFSEKFPDAKDFFAEHFVANYCPLVWMEETGRNRTPDKLPKAEMEPVDAACEAHLRGVVEALDPEWVVGVGAYATKRLEKVVGDLGLKIGTVLHPSPASPAANRGWEAAAEKQLREQEIWDS